MHDSDKLLTAQYDQPVGPTLLTFLLLKYTLPGFPGLFTVISEHICVPLLGFLFLHFLVVGSVR